jgi:hypothetical protein
MNITPAALIQAHIERLTYLADMAAQVRTSLPNSTDSDAAEALLDAMAQTIATDCDALRSVGTGAVTAKVDFTPSVASEPGLFCVREGVPLDEAFEQLSLLLDSANDALRYLSLKEGETMQPTPLWSIYNLLNMANALLDSMQAGHSAGLPINPNKG